MDKCTIELISRTFEDDIYPSAFRDGYEMLECLSASKDAETLLVKHRDDGTLYIAKCYYAGSPLFSRTEEERIQSISHPMLPHFIAEFSNASVRCIIREYIPGQTLEQYCASAPLNENEVRKIALQLCDQLQYLHSMTPPVIHRDIKPQNAIMREDGSVSLIDFGISRPFNENGTTETIAFGTKGFAPPEQYGFAQPDAKSDIYSLGALMQWLLHNTTDYAGKPGTPMEKVIAKCMAFDPKHRYSGISELRRALKSTRKGRRIAKTSGIVAALLAFLCVIGMFLSNQDSIRAKMSDVRMQREMASLGIADKTIYRAVRASLGLEEQARLKSDHLKKVTALYIVGNEVFASSEAFYGGIQAWYQTGQHTGTIRNLDDLSLMPNMKDVCVVGQKLTDIQAVSGLIHLEKIEIKHNSVSDISALSNLLKLGSVGINDNPVRDVSPLASCPELKYLDLCDINSYDGSALAPLGDLVFLDISNQTDSYQYLSGKTISNLKIAWSKMDSLSYLDGVRDIEELEINNCKVADLTPLVSHPELRVLNIKGLPVDDLSILTALPNLEKVIIGPGLAEAAEALGECPFEFVIE